MTSGSYSQAGTANFSTVGAGKYGKMSNATEKALAQINVQHVSQAKEFEEFRRLPKFNHVSMAVIHPSPKKKKPAPKKPIHNFELTAD